MEYLIDESGRQKFLQLLADHLALELVEASQALLHWLGVWSDVKGVLIDLPRYARHVRGDIRKDVGIGAKKVDEHHFLFTVEGGTDLQRLVVGLARVEGHHLDTPGWLEAACVSVRGVHGFACHLVEGGCEGLVIRLSFSALDTLDVALVGVLERWSDGDDALRTRHLYLEVGVVGDRHEFGVAWPSQYGVVCPTEPNHLEGEYLLAEVCRRAEADR